MEESAYEALLDVKVAKASGAGTRRENSAIRDGGGRPSERGSRRQVRRDLFLVTLEKALFSSPAACRATVEKRIRRCELEIKGWGRETRAAAESDGAVAAEVAPLLTLRDALAAIGPGDYAKYQALLEAIQGGRPFKWKATGRGSAEDRLVVFTERIETLHWLRERLAEDLGLGDRQIAILHGTMSDVEQLERQPYIKVVCVLAGE